MQYNNLAASVTWIIVPTFVSDWAYLNLVETLFRIVILFSQNCNQAEVISNIYPL